MPIAAATLQSLSWYIHTYTHVTCVSTLLVPATLAAYMHAACLGDGQGCCGFVIPYWKLELVTLCIELEVS